MGIVDDLGLRVPRDSVLTRPVRLAASTSLGARAFAPVIPTVDRAVVRLSGGRTTGTEWLAGLPTLHLTTTGARTGARRTVPLVGIVVGPDVAVIGSNWGRPRHPGWVHNLAADPRATVSRRGRAVDVHAREASGEEAEGIWQVGRSIYRGFRTYPTRTGGRSIRVFVLEPR